MQAFFSNRIDAGRQLAQKLKDFQGRPNTVVLGLPRGGVPVAAQIAHTLRLPLDVMIVRKIGTPHNPELAMGAVASGGVVIRNESVIDSYGISDRSFQQMTQQELRELERRESIYRPQSTPLQLAGLTIILVDDGIATGSTILAAIEALKKSHVEAIIVAVPVAARESVKILTEKADQVVCVHQPDPFCAVGPCYRDFSQTSDDEVCELLGRYSSTSTE